MTTPPVEAINPIFADFWTRPADVIDAELDALRATEPVAWRPEPYPDVPLLPPSEGYWAVTSYEEILECSKHPEIFSSARGVTNLDTPPEFNEFFSSMIAMDDPRHARLRKIVSAGFTPRMLKRLEDSVQQVAARIVRDVSERGEVDFVVDVAAALPLQIICDMMDIPTSQYRYVFDRTNVILGAGDPEYNAEMTFEAALTGILQAGGDLAQLMDDVAKTKVGATGDDLTTMLVNAEVDGEKLTSAELNSFFVLLVVAGNETTRNAISWGLKYLTDHPDQRAIWAADFEKVAPTAVDEIVRLASPVTYMRRTVAQDTTLAGRDLRAGQKVSMFYYAANRDPKVFTDPLRFDVLRSPNYHIGFGGPGPHFCLGAHLARREITVMFRELFRGLPDIVASGPPSLLQSSFIHGVKHLPATFTPRTPAAAA